MKRAYSLAAALGFLAFVAAPAMGQLVGSPHDLSAGSGGVAIVGVTQTCIFCHAPHGNQNLEGELLWNRDIDGAATTFTMYSNTLTGTLNGTVGTAPSGSSKLCLSCHDGQGAIEDYGGASSGTTFAPAIGTYAAPDLDLSADHPISIVYDETVDLGLADQTVVVGATTYTIGDLLEGTEVQCATCHDVHNEAGQAKLLWADNTTSGLCTTCHLK